jgi:hypothetical protein
MAKRKVGVAEVVRFWHYTDLLAIPDAAGQSIDDEDGATR